MAKPAPSISEQLREILRDCGQSPYALAEVSGVDRVQIQRFVNGQRSLTLDTVDRLAAPLNLEIRVSARRRTSPSPAPKRPWPTPQSEPADGMSG